MGRVGCYSVHLDPHWCCARQFDAVLRHVASSRDGYEHVAVCGDLNTACAGLNRLYPSIGCDNQSRFERVGQSEAEWFERGGGEGKCKVRLRSQGPVYGLYKAKLDWCLLSGGLRVVHKQVGSRKKRCSDHQWVMCDVSLK